MMHSFDSEVAELFHDANIATVFQNLCYWIIHNKTNEKNRQKIEIDGESVDRYFTYNSIQAFLKQFPYFSKKQIENYLTKLRTAGLIAKGNFNEMGFDRTSWYCLVNEDYWMNKYLTPSPQASKRKDDTPEPQNEDQSATDANKPETPYENPESNQSEDQTEVEISNSSISPNGEMHFPKTGNAFLQNGKCISPNGEIEFPKRGNAFLQTGKPIPDINTHLKPNLKPNTASALRELLVELDPTLVFDQEFYPAAEDFLKSQNLGEDYVRWFYQNLKKSTRIVNLPGYFFKVFFQDVYITRYKAFIAANTKATPQAPKPYFCPVCGLEQNVTSGTRACARCDSPLDPAEDDIAKYQALYGMDDSTKELYIAARSRVLRSGGNVGEKLKDLDKQFGLVS